MSRPDYRKLSRNIARGDTRTIEDRWRYGRAVITDPRKMSASGKQLRIGAAEELIAVGKAVGDKLSEREIQYRIQCARAYKAINEILHASAGFAGWAELRNAGFPVTYVDEVPSPDDILDNIEQTDPQEFEQLGLFPPLVKTVPLERCSLRYLLAYADEMEAMTASFARRDRERRAHLSALCMAVEGDLDVLYPDAVSRWVAA